MTADASPDAAARCSPSSPTPTTSRSRAAGCWRWCAARGRTCRCSALSRRGWVQLDDPDATCAWGSRAHASSTRRPGVSACSEVIAARPPQRVPALGRARRAGGRHPRGHRRLQPDVVITFDEDGLYWHPDHIVLHERTTAVVARTGRSRRRRLFYVTMPPGACAACVERCGGSRTAASPRHGRCRHASSASRWMRSGCFHAADARARRRARSPSQAGGPALPSLAGAGRRPRSPARRGQAARLLGVEHYRRAAGRRARRETFIEPHGRIAWGPDGRVPAGPAALPVLRGAPHPARERALVRTPMAASSRA